jgi:hypothetical protein
MSDEPMAEVREMTDEEFDAWRVKDALWTFHHLIDGHDHTEAEAMEVVLREDRKYRGRA